MTLQPGLNPGDPATWNTWNNGTFVDVEYAQRYAPSYDPATRMHRYMGQAISDEHIQQEALAGEPLQNTLDRIVAKRRGVPNQFMQTFRTNGEKLEADEDEILIEWHPPEKARKSNDENVINYLARKARENSGRD